MPVEIRELVIRAVVQPQGQGMGGSQARDERGGGDEPAPVDHEQLIQECVRQVMRILAAQRER
jgi:hypothetical protein